MIKNLYRTLKAEATLCGNDLELQSHVIKISNVKENYFIPV